MALKSLQSLGADDIFISYTRRDASTYAAGLADELTKRGFSCFIDKLGTDPDEDLPDSLKRKIRSCSMLVVVGTAWASKRQTIKEEVAEFVSTGRTSVVPIDFGDTVYGADWYKPIKGVAPERELNPNALDDGNPSPTVVSRIEKQFNYRRRDERLRRITRRAIAVLVLLLIAIAVAAGVAFQQLARAADATARANEETHRAERATREAQAAQDAARTAKNEADAARDEATKQRDEATKQKGIADKATLDATEKARLANEAARRANESEARATTAQARADTEQARAERQAAIADIRARANRSQSYLRQRPEDVPVSLSFALDAMKMAERVGVRNADADEALRESLALLPLRHSRVPLSQLDQLTGVAFSPDGLHYAVSYSGSLHVYATSDKDEQNAKPLLERPCKCAAAALASGLTRAAAVLSGERGFVIFDLKRDSPGYVFESFEGEPGEKITSAEKLALSPDGRYLALYAHVGEEDSDGRHSKLLVVDTKSGDTVKIFDDDATGASSAKDITFGPTGRLNMLIRDVTFGPAGDLAIVGKRVGVPEGRAIIWRLNADAHPPNTPASLTPDSFTDYEVIPQAMDVSAVAPGADATYFATNKGVWKRPAWQTRFDPVARIPAPANESIFSTDRMAFRDGGKSLALARIVVLTASGKLKLSSINEYVEVWDATGHTGRAEAFHAAEVVRAGFEPGGRRVAALTEYDSKNLKDGPLGENRARRLRVYQTDTGTEVAATEPKPEDRGAFYVGPDAAQIVTLSGKTVKVWDVWAKDEERRKRVASFDGAMDGVASLALSPGGRFLVLAGFRGAVMRAVVYRSDGGDYTEVKRFGLGGRELRWDGGLTLSADGRRLVAFDRRDENPVRVFDDGAENATLRERLDGLTDVTAVALSADGRHLAVSDQLALTGAFRQTGRARLLDLDEGSWETLLEDELVTSIAFSPDGAYVGLGSDEGVLHVFETATPKDAGGAAKADARSLKEGIARLRHAGKITAVAFSDDGRYVATASSQPQPYSAEDEESNPLRVWLLRPADLIAESERRLRFAYLFN